MRHGNRPQSKLELKVKEWGEDHGYFGRGGGWIYHEISQNPVCHGWQKLYQLHRDEIDAWIRNGNMTKTRKAYKDRPKENCVYCSIELDRSNIKRHEKACSLLPEGILLAKQLDDDPKLSAYSLAHQYNVDVSVVFRKMIASTSWTHDQLHARGIRLRTEVSKDCRAINTQQKKEMIANGAVFCVFCEVANDKPVCIECDQTLQRYADNGSMPDSWQDRLFQAIEERTLPKKYVKQFKKKR